MADPNQAQLTALLALLGDSSRAKLNFLTSSASQQQGKPLGQSSTPAVPPPTASGSLDLSALQPTSSGSGFYDTASFRYNDMGNNRRAHDDDCTSPISEPLTC
jgi:hypothetical protein